MRHLLLTRSAYGPSWDIEANRRRLALTEGVSVRSMRAQTSQDWRWVVLLNRHDPLLEERQRVFASRGAWFLYVEDDIANHANMAYLAYRAPWAEAIGHRDDTVVMTRLDDDDAFAPWAMERLQEVAERIPKRAVLMFPNGIRVWEGRVTPVRHFSNAMQTLVTPPGDDATVYDYGHRDAKKFAPVKLIDSRIAWLWSRHRDTISGWRTAQEPLTDTYRGMFPIDWTLFGEPSGGVLRLASGHAGRVFR